VTKKEIASRKVLRELVRLARTPLSTTAEFINAHGIVGISLADEEGLSWAARIRLYDAFQLAAILNGDYGLLSAQSAKSQVAGTTPALKPLPRRDQEAARKVVVEMVRLARTPVKTVAEFIVAQGVSGVSFGESGGLSQDAHDRLHAAFKKANFLRRAAKKAEPAPAQPRFGLVG
jgi:hypothetical protein